jgi:hypothetical protein
MTQPEPQGDGTPERREPDPLLPRNFGDYAHWPERFIERRKLLETLPASDVRADALSMCTLDAATDPKHREVMDARPLGRAIAELAVYLLFRAQHRAACALRNQPFTPPVEEAEQRQRAAQVEPCFHAAMLAAFPRPEGAPADLPFDRRRFERAFARFSAGELAMRELVPKAPARLLLDGTPDGSYHVCFAEAALLFVRFGLNADFWRLTLRTFVAGTATFAVNHWSGMARNLDAYQAGFRQPLLSGAATLQALRLHYGALDLSQLLRSHGEQLATMLRDEARLPHVIAVPEEFR